MKNERHIAEIFTAGDGFAMPVIFPMSSTLHSYPQGSRVKSFHHWPFMVARNEAGGVEGHADSFGEIQIGARGP